MNNRTNERKEKKKKNHVSFKAMIIAMIVALLAFLGIGNYELGNGDGVDTGEGREGVEESVGNIDSNKTNEEDVSTEDAVDSGVVFYIHVNEETILIGKEDMVEVTIEELEGELKALDMSALVIIVDDGSVKRVYDEVEDLVDSMDLRKVEQ